MNDSELKEKMFQKGKLVTEKITRFLQESLREEIKECKETNDYLAIHDMYAFALVESLLRIKILSEQINDRKPDEEFLTDFNDTIRNIYFNFKAI